MANPNNNSSILPLIENLKTRLQDNERKTRIAENKLEKLESKDLVKRVHKLEKDNAVLKKHIVEVYKALNMQANDLMEVGLMGVQQRRANSVNVPMGSTLQVPGAGGPVTSAGGNHGDEEGEARRKSAAEQVEDQRVLYDIPDDKTGEDLIDKIYTFIETKLGNAQARTNIKVMVAKRIGPPPGRGGAARPVIARWMDKALYEELERQEEEKARRMRDRAQSCVNITKN